ncbi:MAG: PVC-type heme-binding CxxCH protein [Verrucomicrobiales bacterium]
MPRICFFLFCLCGLPAAADTFPEPHDSERDVDAAPLSPEAAARGTEIPAGFAVDVFASEPEVRNPIAMTWDFRGRLWIAENYTYAEKGVRFEEGLRDRVLIFEDANGDGKVDRRTVFTDQAQRLTSVEVGRGGVWLMCPPTLLFLPDTDADDVPDAAPQVVLDGFTVGDANHHNFANGLRWGPDGWLYGRCGHSSPGNIGVPGAAEADRVPIKGGVWRFHPDTKVVEVLTHGTTNPWGHDWDRHGELFFINTVNGHLWHGFPGAHFKESSGVDPHPHVYEVLDTHADHWHWDTAGEWSASRDGRADDFGGGHAHVGMMIYQADQWPESFRDKLYTLNLHGRRANVERLERLGSGFAGRHEPDTFLAEDPWFRGIEIGTGPEGAGYVLDWSDTGECHEHTGVHRNSGRIYRIRHGETAKPDFSTLEIQTPESVERNLRHPNDWFARQGRVRLAADDAAPGISERLHEIALDDEEETVVRLRALWALMTMQNAVVDTVARTLLDDPDEALRKWGVAASTDRWPLDRVAGPVAVDRPPLDDALLAKFVDMAGTDESGLVRLALASTLQRLPVSRRSELGTALASRPEDADDHNLPSMVWWGVSPVIESDPGAIVRLAENCVWPDTVRWAARALAERIEDSPAPLDTLLSLAAEKDLPWRAAVIRGLDEGLLGWRQAPEPDSWDRLAAVAAKEKRHAETVRELSGLFGDGRALDSIRDTVLDEEADLASRTAALETLMETRPPFLRELCEKALDVRYLNVTAARGLALFDDEKIGAELLKRYRRFKPGDRATVVEILTSRRAWASALLDEIAAGRVPAADLTPYHARQIATFDDEDLAIKLSRSWGDSRESSTEKQSRIGYWKGELTPEVLEKADLSRGRVAFAKICASCHVLYGEGNRIGPDLTGSGRADLDYLLENIVDPGAMVSADQRMTVATLDDGRVLTGVVADETDRTLSLRSLTGEITVEKSRIEKREVPPVSMMPEGLLRTLPAEDVRDLIAYLMHPAQVP